MRTIPLILIIWLTAITSLFAQAPWSGSPMQKGIAAVTCGAPSTDSSGGSIPASASFTFGLFDVRNPSASDYGPCNPGGPFGVLTTPLWDAPQWHHPSWNAEDLGNVFGIAIDDNDDIYVAAHGLYGRYQPLHRRYGNIGGGAADLNAAGTVYRISGTTGVVSVFCVIPGQQVMPLATDWSGTPSLLSGPGLGNVTYDYDHDQFFVTSLEDGMIYRVDSSGTVVESHDPLTPDDGAANMPSRDDRLWAVEYEDNFVYYSVWNDGSIGSPSEIRRVSLLPSGAFAPSTDVHVIDAPGQSTAGSSRPSPIVDITFSLDGLHMYAGARTMEDDITAYNHSSGTHRFELISGSWTHTHFQRTGCNAADGEGFGGVALGEEFGTQDSILWNSSADMAVNYGPHGIFGVRVGDVPVTGQAAHSWKVPYMPGFTNTSSEDLKGSGGDVEILRLRDDCARIEVLAIHCPDELGLPYTVDLTITHNVTTSTVKYLQFKPCPVASLPAGSTTVQPSPSGIITLSPPLPPMTTLPYTVTLPVSPAGGMVYFKVKLLNETGAECCLETVCVDLPPCDCVEIVDTQIDCVPDPVTGLNKYVLTFSIRNLTHLSGSPFAFSGATFLPPAGFDQSSIVLSPTSIPPGGTGSVSICYYGTPGPLCFNLAVHDGTEENCCALTDLCVDLPPCDSDPEPKPDTCALERKVACCPATGFATLNYTICNNSLAPRTYTWNAVSTPDAACPVPLDPSDFSPSSGTLGPIPPNGCMTVTILVNCEKLTADTPCAKVEICADAGLGLAPLCCKSEVYRPKDGTVIIKSDDPAGLGEPITVGPSEVREVRVKLENPTGSDLPVTLRFYDELRRLTLVGTDGTTQENRPIEVIVPANESLIVSQFVARNDNGESTGWSEIQVYAYGEFPVAIIPVRLASGDRAKTQPKIKAIETTQAPSSTVQLEIETLPGRYYRVEESADMLNNWITTNCTVTDGGYANGIFVGNGSIVNCSVPCDELEQKMFYRVVRID